MAHFARVKNSIVTSVIVIEPEVLETEGGWLCPNTGEFAVKEEWIQTSYNTQEGDYKKGDTQQEKDSLRNAGGVEDVKARSRRNYAGVGFTYDSVLDAFLPPKQFNSWVLDTQKGVYIAPKPKPVDRGDYVWSEEDEDWVIRP